MAETRSMLLNEAVVRETEEVLGRLEQAIAERNQQFDKRMAELREAIQLFSDQVNHSSSCGHLQQKQPRLEPDHERKQWIENFDRRRKSHEVIDSNSQEIESSVDNIVTQSKVILQHSSAPSAAFSHFQVPKYHLEPSLGCCNEPLNVFETWPSEIVRNIGVQSQSGLECVMSKNNAHQVFDRLLLRRHKFQQRRKLSLSPKSWKFKYKKVKWMRRNAHYKLKGGMIIKQLHEMSQVYSRFRQKAGIELDMSGWDYKTRMNPEYIRWKSMCDVAELQETKSRALCVSADHDVRDGYNCELDFSQVNCSDIEEVVKKLQSRLVISVREENSQSRYFRISRKENEGKCFTYLHWLKRVWDPRDLPAKATQWNWPKKCYNRYNMLELSNSQLHWRHGPDLKMKKKRKESKSWMFKYKNQNHGIKRLHNQDIYFAALCDRRSDWLRNTQIGKPYYSLELNTSGVDSLAAFVNVFAKLQYDFVIDISQSVFGAAVVITHGDKRVSAVTFKWCSAKLQIISADAFSQRGTKNFIRSLRTLQDLQKFTLGVVQFQIKHTRRTKVAVVARSLQERENMLLVLKFHLLRAQHRMKQAADSHRSEGHFDVGDSVFVKLQPYRQGSVVMRPNAKLAPKYYGPYKVVDHCGKVAYKLLLPQGSLIHPVFHVSQLKAVVERKMVKRQGRAATMVLVQWTSESKEEATWEYLFDLQKMFPSFEPCGQGSSTGGALI
ncbi:Chromo-like domain superfamily [Arabidopsis thaliana x Arabidopsis arenosa]|uniref:Chromo-like domain superfamily n=1 Tax=Arabidopsis thaliana x Arabidopsis arenosa TaxID=1240361 RepID=A0A8T2AY44_9BRAS|nr:Chromo-like domain superfamily [Arabidopsis thaliana x Arabidopsis arenosa]